MVFFDGGVTTSAPSRPPSLTFLRTGDLKAGDFELVALEVLTDPGFGRFTDRAEDVERSSSWVGRGRLLLTLHSDWKSFSRRLNLKTTTTESLLEEEEGLVVFDANSCGPGRFPASFDGSADDVAGFFTGSDFFGEVTVPGCGERPDGVADRLGGFLPAEIDFVGFPLTKDDERGRLDELLVCVALLLRDPAFSLAFSFSSAARASSMTFGSVGLSIPGSWSSGMKGGDGRRAGGLLSVDLDGGRAGDTVLCRFTGRDDEESGVAVRRMVDELIGDATVFDLGSGGLYRPLKSAIQLLTL